MLWLQTCTNKIQPHNRKMGLTHQPLHSDICVCTTYTLPRVEDFTTGKNGITKRWRGVVSDRSPLRFKENIFKEMDLQELVKKSNGDDQESYQIVPSWYLWECIEQENIRAERRRIHENKAENWLDLWTTGFWSWLVWF